MTRRSLLSMVLVLAVPAFAFGAGGWAIISVDDLPEYLVAGQPTELSFVVRQHGMTPLDRLSPSIEAKGAGKTISVQAMPAKGSGHYSALVTVPQAGEWTLTIASGFGPSKVTLLPMRAVASGAPRPAATPDATRGARLFVAKGCVGCHVHALVDRPTLVKAGPELTERRYPAAYLSKILADPATIPVTRPGVRMPNLGLRDEEIRTLVAFINSDPSRPVVGR